MKTRNGVGEKTNFGISNLKTEQIGKLNEPKLIKQCELRLYVVVILRNVLYEKSSSLK